MRWPAEWMEQNCLFLQYDNSGDRPWARVEPIVAPDLRDPGSDGKLPFFQYLDAVVELAALRVAVGGA